jgi:hypothetical protein
MSAEINAAERYLEGDNEQYIPENTRLAYENKSKEFTQYCDEIFGHLPYPQAITEEKVFGFLFYHAYRGHFMA